MALTDFDLVLFGGSGDLAMRKLLPAMYARDVCNDLPATARVITDEAERRTLLTEVARNWKRDDLEEMVRYSPLIEVTFDDGVA